MDDGAVLLADRWVARVDRDRPQPTVLVRSPYGRDKAVGLLFGRLLAERGLQVVIQSVRGTFGSEGSVRPIRRACRRARDAALDPLAAVACRSDRDDRPELPRARAVGGCVRGRRRSSGARDRGERVAVLRADVRRREPRARERRLVAGARLDPGGPVRADRDQPRAAAAASADGRVAARRPRRARARRAGAVVSRGGPALRPRQRLLGGARLLDRRRGGASAGSVRRRLVRHPAAVDARGLHGATGRRTRSAAANRAVDAYRARPRGRIAPRRDRVAAGAPARR